MLQVLDLWCRESCLYRRFSHKGLVFIAIALCHAIIALREGGASSRDS